MQIVDTFLAEWCQHGERLSVTQLALFNKFRVFWAQETKHWVDEASFNDFAAEMQRRGYRASQTGRRYWYGLALRKKPKSELRRIRQR